jgi:hypothetical protein
MPLPVTKGKSGQQPKAEQYLTRFPHGLNNTNPPLHLHPTECSELTNFRILKSGALQTREGIKKRTTTALDASGVPKFFCVVNIAGTTTGLAVDDNYELYRVTTVSPVAITTLEGDAEILGYNGVALIMDGSYLKYMDTISSVKIAYDDGTGASGYQYTNLTGESDTWLPIGNGTYSRGAAAFTSQSWDAGYTIPPTTIQAKMQRVGNGFTGTDNVDVTFRLRAQSDDAILAEKVFIESPILSNLSATETEYSITLEADDITTEMSPSTAYYASIEYNNGDATNYVRVMSEYVDSGNSGFVYASSWQAGSFDESPIMGIRPGRPPKGSFGEIHSNRPFIVDPDNPGLVRFGNLTYLDWSTSDGGGYIGVVDDDSNSFEVGGLKSIFGDLYVIGSSDSPYLCKLTGDSPSEYALPTLFQRAKCTSKTIVNAVNDVWFGSEDGINSLRGVEVYGDVRTESHSDPIGGDILEYWSDLTLCGYYPRTGQLFAYLDGLPYVYVCHIRNPATMPNGTIRYPWSRYEFTNGHLTDTSLYKWTASSSVTNGYYLEAATGGDPGLTAGDKLVADGYNMGDAESSVSGLSNLQWGFGDEDTLGYSTFYVCLTQGSPSDQSMDIRSVIVPTCFGNDGDNLVFGASDGLFYWFDETYTKDLDTHNIDFLWAGQDIQFPFDFVSVDDIRADVCANGWYSGDSGTLDLKVFINGEYNNERYSVNLTVPDNRSMNIGDYSTSSHDEGNTYRRSAVTVRSIMFKLANFITEDKPINIGGLFFRYRPVKVYSVDNTFSNTRYILDATLGDPIADGAGGYLEE